LVAAFVSLVAAFASLVAAFASLVAAFAAGMALDQALAKVMQHFLKEDTQVYKQFVENDSFKRFVGEMVYELTRQ
jgi:hypothetical protein